jgi:hypothetical protein
MPLENNPFDLPSEPINVEAMASAAAQTTDVPDGNPFNTMTGGVQQPQPQPQPQQTIAPSPFNNPITTPTPAANNMTNTGFSGFNEPAPAANPQTGFTNNGGFGNNNGGFGGNNQQGGFGGNNQGNNQKRKYKFVQLYWLINQKLFAKQQLAAGEAPLIEISYNVDYGNLRISFIKVNQNTFDATSIRVQNTDRATTVNIYGETADQILFNLEHGVVGQIAVFERMIQASASWSPNQTIFTINQDGSVTLATKVANNQDTHSYTFSGWQIKSLKNALKFLTDGPAYIVDISKFLSTE